MPLSKVDPKHYTEIFKTKADVVSKLFSELQHPEIERHSSPDSSYRMRAEFRIWHQEDDLYYAMFEPEDPKKPCRIEAFPIASSVIQRLMPVLLEKLKNNTSLRNRLFQVEFLSTQIHEVLVSLIYHRRLDEQWKTEADALAKELDIALIGRSRKQKVVINRDYVEEQLTINGDIYFYRQYEQSFTQPNAAVNQKMIAWALSCAENCGADLIELYCGNGNFTLPLSRYFTRILATEISKTSVRAALHNLQCNGIDNVDIIRMSAEDMSKAMAGERKFRRLRDLPLSGFNFSTVFVDPPRAGLDQLTESLLSHFDNIIYISCNPITLRANLETLCKTHDIVRMAFFDQFPYTNHMESGVFLKRR